MFDLQRMDHDFYMWRAEWKSKQNFKMEDIRNGMDVHHILSGGNVEMFFADIVREIAEISEQYRSKALF